MKDPFNIVPKLMPLLSDCEDQEDAIDLQAGLTKHTSKYEDSFIPEDKIERGNETELSKAHSLMPPRRKNNSSM